MSTPDLARMIRELTRPSTQRVKRPDGTSYHVASAPSLLDQLSSLEPSTAEGARRGFASRPTANLEAVDLGQSIDREAAALVRSLGEDDDGDAKAMVLKLHGLTASLDAHMVGGVTHYVHRWWASARVMSGWDAAPFRPHNTCPVCTTLGNLRIRVDEMLAHCVHCRATWDSANLGVLADHIRHENGEEAA